MKHWRVDWAIKYVNGKEKELVGTVEAQSITVALAIAINDFMGPRKNDPEISEVVIWSIGIIEDKVF